MPPSFYWHNIHINSSVLRFFNSKQLFFKTLFSLKLKNFKTNNFICMYQPRYVYILEGVYFFHKISFNRVHIKKKQTLFSVYFACVLKVPVIIQKEGRLSEIIGTVKKFMKSK